MKDLKQTIADGVAIWLRDYAPIGIKMMIDQERCSSLVQTICDQFSAEDFDRVSSPSR